MTEDLNGFQFEERQLTNLTHSFLSSACVSSLGKWKVGTFSFKFSPLTGAPFTCISNFTLLFGVS